MNSDKDLCNKCQKLEDALIKIRRIQYVTPAGKGDGLIAMVVKIAKDALEYEQKQPY